MSRENRLLDEIEDAEVHHQRMSTLVVWASLILAVMLGVLAYGIYAVTVLQKDWGEGFIAGGVFFGIVAALGLGAAISAKAVATDDLRKSRREHRDYLDRSY